mmetsp:Transcript_3688/g.5419  ORF Transcript_3688/g.5419 Transcript_3688/m.5419 type:complete len:222 (+) Transcript_3688:134-799(+)
MTFSSPCQIVLRACLLTFLVSTYSASASTTTATTADTPASSNHLVDHHHWTTSHKASDFGGILVSDTLVSAATAEQQEHVETQQEEQTEEEECLSSSSNLLQWEGSWKFEESYFQQQHPWLPKFVIRRLLKTRLVLEEISAKNKAAADPQQETHVYHQVDDKGKAVKPKRSMKIINISNTKVEFQRQEDDNTIVAFHLEKRDDDYMYYVEPNLGTYRVLAA